LHIYPKNFIKRKRKRKKEKKDKKISARWLGLGLFGHPQHDGATFSSSLRQQIPSTVEGIRSGIFGGGPLFAISS